MRTRREPPPWRTVAVGEVVALTPRLVHLTLVGPALTSFDPGLPGASLRLLVPDADRDLDVAVPVLPRWNGNEFRHEDGSRAVIRTLTPLVPVTPVDGPAIAVAVVLHGHGPLATWAASTRPGERLAIAGTGRGYEIDPAAGSFLLAGDESALPAITTILPALPAAASVHVVVELADPGARLDLPSHPGAHVQWCEAAAGDAPGTAVVGAVASAELGPDTRVWAAGEAAAMQRIRRHLTDERDVPRSRAVVRGYWKHGRAGGDED